MDALTPTVVTTPITSEGKTPAELVGEYVSLRDAKTEAEKKFKTFMQDNFHKRMEDIEGALLAALNLLGVDTMASPHGTVYKNNKTSATVSDQAQFRGFVVSRQAWDLVDWRANKTQIQTFLKKHKELPPGTNYNVRATVGIRRPTSTLKDEGDNDNE